MSSLLQSLLEHILLVQQCIYCISTGTSTIAECWYRMFPYGLETAEKDFTNHAGRGGIMANHGLPWPGDEIQEYKNQSLTFTVWIPIKVSRP